MDKLIKGIPEKSWRLFKAGAAKRELKLGEYFSMLVKEHTKEELSVKESWDKILNGEPSITDEEAETILKASKRHRKNFRMRDFSDNF